MSFIRSKWKPEQVPMSSRYLTESRPLQVLTIEKVSIHIQEGVGVLAAFKRLNPQLSQVIIKEVVGSNNKKGRQMWGLGRNSINHWSAQGPFRINWCRVLADLSLWGSTLSSLSCIGTWATRTNSGWRSRRVIWICSWNWSKVMSRSSTRIRLASSLRKWI